MPNERPARLRRAKYLTFALGACTAASDGAYLFYLNSHHMVRSWSGANSVLLGLFMASWSAVLTLAGSRWFGGAMAVIAVMNVAAGVLFLL